MNDNSQDRSQSQGQQGIGKDTGQRNRENEAGQQQAQPGGQDIREEAGQAAERSDTGESGQGFVGTSKEDSGDYLTKDQEGQGFAPEGQGAQETTESNIETGKASERDAELDDGSSGADR